MRSYAIHRPIGPFTWPSEHLNLVMDMVNFDTLQFVPEIGRNAYGYIDWAELPPTEDLRRYELVVPTKEDPFLDKIGRILADFERNGDEDRLERGWRKASERYGYSDEQIGAAMERHMG